MGLKKIIQRSEFPYQWRAQLNKCMVWKLPAENFWWSQFYEKNFLQCFNAGEELIFDFKIRFNYDWSWIRLKSWNSFFLKLDIGLLSPNCLLNQFLMIHSDGFSIFSYFKIENKNQLVLYFCCQSFTIFTLENIVNLFCFLVFFPQSINCCIDFIGGLRKKNVDY